MNRLNTEINSSSSTLSPRNSLKNKLPLEWFSIYSKCQENTRPTSQVRWPMTTFLQWFRVSFKLLYGSLFEKNELTPWRSIGAPQTVLVWLLCAATISVPISVTISPFCLICKERHQCKLNFRTVKRLKNIFQSSIFTLPRVCLNYPFGICFVTSLWRLCNSMALPISLSTHNCDQDISIIKPHIMVR